MKKKIHIGLIPGNRVFITDLDHPYAGLAGELVAFETYGLGWTGWRIELDGNYGQTYAKEYQFTAIERMIRGRP